MSNLNSSMVITSTGLAGVSKKLVDARNFDSSQIEINGNPLILNGEASALSENNFFLKKDLDLSNTEEIEIVFKGIYGTGKQGETCAWCLISDIETISALISTTNILIYSSLRGVLVRLSNLLISNGDKIDLQVKITAEKCSVIAFINSAVANNEQSIGKIDLSRIKTLGLGINPAEVQKFWAGSIYLQDFEVLKNSQRYYSPSKGVTFSFTKLLVSDGSIPLTDTSGPILDKISECKLTEIARSNNNILLKVNIDESINMSIKEAGLYCDIDGSQILFSLIQDLSIDKSVKLGYSLILHAKLDLNIVNTTVKPEIIIEEVENTGLSEFNTIKNTYINSIPNFERVIKGNALGLGNYNSKDNINSDELLDTTKNFEEQPGQTRVMSDYKGNGVGYNNAQVLYRLNNTLRENKDGYGAALNYALIKKRSDLKQRTVFAKELINTIGDIEITDNGVASNFSANNYVVMNAYSDNLDSFDLEVAFKIDSYTNEKEAICCMSNECINNPIIVSVKSGVLHIEMGQLEKLVASQDGYQCTFTRGAHTEIVDNVKYYIWNYEGEITGVPAAIYTKEKEPSVGSSIFQKVNGVLEMSELSFMYSTARILFEADLARVNLSSATKLKVTFDGNFYRFYIAENLREYTLRRTFMSPTRINSVSKVLFGVTIEGDEIINPFAGQVILKEFTFNTKLNSFSLVRKAKGSVAVLRDFYHFPEVNSNFLKVNNLGVNETYITKIDKSFTGEKDSIDFSSTNGCSLCLRANLRDLSDKLIITKMNKGSNIYFFKFEMVDRTLALRILFDEREVVISKKIEEKDIGKFTSFPVLFTIMRTSGTYEGLYKLYLNEECIASTLIPELLTQDSSSGYLTNFTGTPAEANYVQDIVSFEGELTEDDIHFLCCVLDTRV